MAVIQVGPGVVEPLRAVAVDLRVSEFIADTPAGPEERSIFPLYSIAMLPFLL